ncbi:MULTISPECIES: LysR family transcriptional regulator [unclassified Bordetella]|uniref:LysR family transcriptional regulator n=1 Tax=unclassified Bordetella TaxID=2630031 RepID=UPI0013212E90|nr:MULTISPECIES: LysR family transcriptional regulator [unclassified Bordetella]MVW72947.1 LysR family transcriptional regulator [Bordetella sp. 15P40C-2]MVW80141.1 LysR family transcriptional regulator [Bordetella sp. 02P26C-1]
MSSIRFLRSFLAVAHHGSFSEAAEHMALTQAAISFQMRALETDLGRELFDRTGRLAILNAAGRELLPEIKQLVEFYDRLKRPRTSPGELAGAVSIGAIVSCMGTLSKVVSQLKRQHPSLDVRVLSGKASELASKVEAGDLDAAFVVEGTRKVASMQWTPLYQEPLVVVAPAAVKAQSAAAVLSANPFLRFDRTQRTGRQIDRVLRRLGMHPEEFLELNAIETLVELVRQEVGVTLLPLLNGSNWLSSPDLRIIRLPDEVGQPSRSIGMVERRDHARQTITREICAQCLELFQARGHAQTVG